MARHLRRRLHKIVVQQGFNRSFCRKNAAANGKGVYFAREYAYSISPTYSASDNRGIQNMFFVRVGVGNYCNGARDALTPSDSTVDNEAYPSIYVTYHDAQAYPEYLVRFKATSPPHVFACVCSQQAAGVSLNVR
ncbi:hypothetical protein CTAYLR_003923 [Chrysophaeum taylorii]|uniref:Poly [ADP-ribose] polymerase n=1 Tax=Chrysophaeum taylorii TaxID=2483200 RepID=A0AAD7UBP5_9STRA|nr:hypothetical protein CTAYLR_003923 [Chrysophaeum taylorii]